jgi:phosphoglucosamine mutase
MSRKHFGTDGIRGVANGPILTPELAFKIGQGAGRYLVENNLPRRVVMGRDTRRSGPMLGASLGAGFCSVGVDVVALGVAPTPAVSFAVRREGFGLGAVISASHNPAEDNGIKLFAGNGGKVPDADELQIEALMDAPLDSRPVSGDVGYLRNDASLLTAYEDWLVGLLPERLDGMKIVVDGSHGAAYLLGPNVLQRLGAHVISIGTEPDGMNINAEGGATKPRVVQDAVLQYGADAGVAFDGDADRCVFSDNQGRLINGDRTIALWAAHWKADPPVVVGTVMSNMGFERYLSGQGIHLERAKVGDKYVSERISATGAKIGGEQSGHIIFPAHGPTGDGLVTMLEVLRVLKRESRPLSALFDQFENTPQILINVHVKDKNTWDASPRVGSAITSAEEQLSGRGRVNVRASGTQAVVRIMVEADSYALRDEVAESLLAVLAEEAEGKVHGRTDLTHDLGD